MKANIAISNHRDEKSAGSVVEERRKGGRGKREQRRRDRSLQLLFSPCKACMHAKPSSSLCFFTQVTFLFWSDFGSLSEVLEVHAAATSISDAISPRCSSVPLTTDRALACPRRSETGCCPEARRTARCSALKASQL